jgi:Na+/phosphate symporter
MLRIVVETRKGITHTNPTEQFLGMSFFIALASGIAVAAALAALFAWLVTLEIIVAAMLAALDRGGIISLSAISCEVTK